MKNNLLNVFRVKHTQNITFYLEYSMTSDFTIFAGTYKNAFDNFANKQIDFMQTHSIDWYFEVSTHTPQLIISWVATRSRRPPAYSSYRRWRRRELVVPASSY